jgi:molybdate transport system substrate-binding protein
MSKLVGRLALLAAGFLLVAPAGVPAFAAEIRVITTGAMKEVVLALGAKFEAATGHKLTVTNDTAGGVARKIDAGEVFDVAVITPAFIDQLTAKGKIAAGSRSDVAKVGIGVAVKEGAPKPDISTVEALKKALTAAASVAYIDPASGGSSGIYFSGLLDRLGIADQVKPKAKLQSGGYVADLVAKGQAEIAVHQISEIVPVKGVVLVGPLPPEVQNITTYSAGLSPQPRDSAAAKAFLDFLTGPEAGPILGAVGMERAKTP